jgi:DNA-directed DNA polymerase III PolC
MYLNCKTYYSYRYGTFSTAQLVTEGLEMGAASLALTNINSTQDTWEFYSLCLDAGIKPVLGCEVRNGDAFLYLLLAKNIPGLREINSFLSLHLQAEMPFPGIPSLSGNVWVIYPLGAKAPNQLNTNELIGVQPSEVNKLFTIDISVHTNRFVIRQPVTYKDKKGFNLHRLLRAIDKNIILSKQTSDQVAAEGEMFLSPAKILDAFSRYPAIVTNTLQVIDSCSYSIDLKADKNKKIFTSSLAADKALLEKLAKDGMRSRYGSNKEAHKRVRKELEIIDKLGFNAYFLITWDIIRYAQSRGFYHVGRGSGANSIVAFCLQITDVDPIELDLYFERFLNPYRASPPDFDIDFSHRDRDEVIDYVFKRYGSDHVALLGMVSTFKHDAIIRELGKVFGLPKQEIDGLVSNPLANFKEDKIQQYIISYGALLQGFPNYASIHPGGMLISEEPITQYTALIMPPKGFATAQIDMFTAEDIGLYKIDILSQRGLGHIKEAIQLVRENKGLSVDIHAIEQFKKDPQVAQKIKKADTIGCFYIESPAMRQLLIKLRCSDYLTLVAASSIIRPGVAQSGMMRQYISRFHQPDSFEYLHPKMKELLEETYGVMVYQEDVIKVAHHFAGIDMGEADILRRAMSGKYRGHDGFDKIKERFFANCRSYGYPDAITEEVWRQIQSFGGYSFSKAHSASFAVESYQSLYLKTYFPLEFMVAVINNEGGFYNRELYFHELRRVGGHVEAPCVNRSDYFTNIRGKEVFIGLRLIKGLQADVASRLLEEREAKGPFTGLQDLVTRTAIGIEQLNLLVRIGALRFTGKNKKQLLWEANFLQKRVKEHNKIREALFVDKPLEFTLPDLHHTPMEDAMDEIELLDYPLCSRFDLAELNTNRFVTVSQLPSLVGKEVEMAGAYVTVKYVRTIKKDIMHFGTFIDQNGDWLDTVHFPDTTRRYPLQGVGIYWMKGKVVDDFGAYSIEVKELKKIGMKKDQLA